MSALNDIRAAIVAVLQAVPDIGVVHDYQRYAKTDTEFREHFTVQDGDKKRLAGWYVARKSTREIEAASGVALRVTGWELVGYRGLDDATASEKLFDTVIESVCAGYRADPTLGGVVLDVRDLTMDNPPSGAQVEDVSPVLFCGVLSHRARLFLTTSSAIY